ncbi:MAG TPA: helix-turn-helix transcriptional regulator [Ensifer sp.]|uniref:helix-turn-helix transcriptional regulator n=1 Tax=Ensifer sp. TaxID=1872086 RepID=UPI002E112E73|nr:helix-turn-helix transcriptional regulator [Ensifer sp.]
MQATIPTGHSPFCAMQHAGLDPEDCDTKALLIIDADLQIRFSNRSGGILAREALGSPQRFVSTDRNFAARLQSWLRRCSKGSAGQAARLPLAMTDGRQVAVDAVHLGGFGVDLFVLTVDDPHRMIARNIAEIVRDFSLTTTEARMLALVAEGLDTILAAKRLGIAPTTARTHLQRVFSKTGTARQSQLVHFVATYVPESH